MPLFEIVHQVWAPDMTTAITMTGTVVIAQCIARGDPPDTIAPQATTTKKTEREIVDAVQPDSILCFEDGKRYKSLKRTVGKFGLTPAAYREKWGLPSDFPMVSPNYSATRSALAREHGLGKK